MPPTLDLRSQTTRLKGGLGSRLPLELYALIIEHQEDEELHTCCLVSRAWCRFAQPKLFAVLELSLERHSAACILRFDESPHLASFVTHLYCFGGREDIEGSFDLIPRMSAVLNNANALQLTSRLHNVTSIEVCDFGQWGSVETEVLMQCEQAQSLKIADMGMDAEDFLELVHSLPQLKSLTLSGMECDLPDSELEKHLSSCAPQRLENLELDPVGRRADLIMWLLSPRFDLAGLKRAVFSWSQVCEEEWEDESEEALLPRALSRLISSAGPSLEDLVLGVKGADDVYATPITDPCLRDLLQSAGLSKLSSLRTLTLLDITSQTAGNSTTIYGLSICALLPLIVSPLLHEITIQVELAPIPQESASIIDTLPEWQAIDEILAGAHFPSIESVAIKLRVISWELTWPLSIPANMTSFPTPSWDDAAELVKRCLPRLVAVGRLTVRK